MNLKMFLEQIILFWFDLKFDFSANSFEEKTDFSLLLQHFATCNLIFEFHLHVSLFVLCLNGFFSENISSFFTKSWDELLFVRRFWANTCVFKWLGWVTLYFVFEPTSTCLCVYFLVCNEPRKMSYNRALSATPPPPPILEFII